MSSELERRIAANLQGIEDRINAACRRAGRDPAEVTLVAVSKTLPASMVEAAYAAGARDFGENYGQELRDKAAELSGLQGLRWHFIGGLQKNKVKYAAGKACLIHSVDSARLITEVDRRAGAQGVTQEILVQLSLAGEAQKSGAQADEARQVLAALAACPHTRCVGLMTMPPFFDDPLRARPLFARLREIRDELARESLANVSLDHLSMGMSGDFEVAVEEGATLVRVGTAIFGGRG